jgi:hypothetical protein
MTLVVSVPRYCGRISPGPLTYDCSLFSGPRVAQFHTIGPLSIWCLAIASEIWEAMQLIFFSCYAGRVTVMPNPYTGFKTSDNFVFFLWLGRPVCCHQSCLVFLLVPSLWRARAAATDYFLLFSVLFLGPNTSFLIPNVFSP